MCVRCRYHCGTFSRSRSRQVRCCPIFVECCLQFTFPTPGLWYHLYLPRGSSFERLASDAFMPWCRHGRRLEAVSELSSVVFHNSRGGRARSRPVTVYLRCAWRHGSKGQWCRVDQLWCSSGGQRAEQCVCGEGQRGKCGEKRGRGRAMEAAREFVWLVVCECIGCLTKYWCSFQSVS